MAEKISLAPNLDYNTLADLCQDHVQHFQDDKSESSQQLCKILSSILESLETIPVVTEDISNRISEFDFDENIQANGYRSFLFILEKAIKNSIKLCQNLKSSRSSYFFRKGNFISEIEIYSQIIKSMIDCMFHLKTLMSWSESGGLFPKSHHSLEELIAPKEHRINQYCFYGRCLGFQYCESVGTILKALSILMASFSEVYYGGRMIDSLWNGSKHFIDPELRAKRIVNISQYASVNFCKTFWFLGEMELMQRLPSFVSHSLVVNKVIIIEPQPFSFTTFDGNVVDIPIPSAHKGHAPLLVRLLSSVRRFGMQDETGGSEGMKLPSKNLILHCHGGGFVAQSSRSHETYLRQWAIELDCPILSVDYSLAPEAPYPRALEEVFFAYCWAISNAHILGSTAERVILAGDSAGANISLGVTFKCIEYGVRPPDGLFLAYAPVILSFVPSPSRMLCLMDAILPFGFIMNCSKAYACSPESYATLNHHEKKLRKNIDNLEPERSPVKSQSGTPTHTSSEDGEISEAILSRPLILEGSDSTGLLTRVANSLSKKLPRLSIVKNVQEESLEEEIQNETFLPCPLDMLNFEIPNDPYISPYYISDDILRQFPPVTLLSINLDPFLDDSIEFAKKLKRLGNDVNIEILDGLCHGFLNFSMLSSEAHEGSKVCIKWIKKMLCADTEPSP